MNLVTKISTLVVVTLSFLCFVEALKCFRCTLFNYKGICLYKEDPCETQSNQVCVWWATYAGLSYQAKSRTPNLGREIPPNAMITKIVDVPTTAIQAMEEPTHSMVLCI
ncbi:prostate and testis expressed protein 4-like [Mastomys coucha]|uniref:prostate and testis expressed protein 4-like n=1 Tax=Mastomys coucha TaxID=35658 RepID=UPI00126171F3|nr:prostate and testis expressed protein 4-like [Mastomys coucha]